jgi:hypothetical protein
MCYSCWTLQDSLDYFYTTFFQVGLVFPIYVGLMVQSVFTVTSEMDNLDGMGLYRRGGSRDTREGLARILEAPSLPLNSRSLSLSDMYNRLKQKTWIDEALISTDRRAAELMVANAYLVSEGKMEATGSIKSYLDQSFAQTLSSFVNLSPWAYFVLVPALLLANSIDLMTNAISPLSINAAASAGYYVSEWYALFPSLAVTGLSVYWGFVNFWKMSVIKSMILPTVVYDPSIGSARILSPRIDSQEQRAEFDSSPPDIAGWETAIREKINPTGASDESILSSLYGKAGSDGSQMYLDSIRYHTWLVIASIVFYGTSIISRDWSVLSSGGGIAWEFVMYSVLMGLNLGQAFLLPVTL